MRSRPSASPDDSTLNLPARSMSPPFQLAGGPPSCASAARPTRQAPGTPAPDQPRPPAQFRRVTTGWGTYARAGVAQNFQKENPREGGLRRPPLSSWRTTTAFTHSPACAHEKLRIEDGTPRPARARDPERIVIGQVGDRALRSTRAWRIGRWEPKVSDCSDGTKRRAGPVGRARRVRRSRKRQRPLNP